MQKKLLCMYFFLFFCFQTSCMTLDFCVNVFDNIAVTLDYKSHMRFFMTCKNFYEISTKYPHLDDYTNAMVHCARKNDVKNFNLLIKHEGPINKKNRQHIENFFNRFPPKMSTIDLYGKIYNKENAYDFNIGVMYYVFKNNKLVFDFLLKQEYIYTFNPWPMSDLQLAALSNNLAYVKVLLKFNQDLVDRNFQGDSGITPLCSAFMLRQFKMVKLLLADPYVDINRQNGSGDTLLHLVVKKENREILKLLVANPKLNYTIKNNDGRTAYDYAEDLYIKSLLSWYSF